MDTNEKDKRAEPDSLREALDLLQEIREMGRHDDDDYRRLVGHIRRRRRRKVFGAAAAAIVAAIAVPLLIINITHAGSETDKIDALAGINAPRLELPGGEQIVLDAGMHGGLITDGADVSVKMDDGVIRYEKKRDATELTFNTLHVPCGSNACDIILEDGTRVWLNAGSMLKFPAVFTKEERTVFLEGEAYFEVARNERSPFIVVGGGQTLTVLGTRFNVRAYADDTEIATTLVSGSVKVAKDGTDQAIVLSPSQQSVFDKGSGRLTATKVDPEHFISWKEGIIDMEKRSLKEIAQTLSRLYGMGFVFENEGLMSITYRGSVPRYDKLTDVLKVIETCSPVCFGASDGVIRVQHRKQD